MTVQITIKSNLTRNARKYVRDLPQVVAKTFTTTSWLVLGDAIPITPLRDGILRSTAHVKPPVIAGNQVVVEFGFGGPAAPYAFRVHELPESSNWTTPGTGPKYLEKPIRARIPKLGSEWSSSVQTQTKGTFGS